MIPLNDERRESSPLERTLQVSIVLFSTLTFSYLALMLASWLTFEIWGYGIMGNLQDAVSKLNAGEIEGLNQGQLNAYKLTQFLYHLGTYALPPFFFLLIVRKNAWSFLGMNLHARARAYWLIPLIYLLTYPFIAYLLQLNLSLDYGALFGESVGWMADKEKELDLLTDQLLEVSTFGGMLVNLLVFAAFPAFAEELFFRGLIQGVLANWIRRHHLAIWITAFLFSAIHMQFYGFLPRFVIGALLGYVYCWSRDLKLSILLHFINNAVAVVAVYLWHNGYTELNPDTEMNFWVAISFLLISLPVLIWFFRINRKHMKRVESKSEKVQWVKIYGLQDGIKARLIQDRLLNEGYNAVLINKKDSSYLFGEAEIYVPSYERESAGHFLQKIEAND